MTEKNCITCGEKAFTEHDTASYEAFANHIHFITERGQCLGCKNYFCNKHYVEYLDDDETGILEDRYFCCNCYKKQKQLVKARADWWRENMPIVGRLIAFCIEAETGRVHGPGKNL